MKLNALLLVNLAILTEAFQVMQPRRRWGKPMVQVVTDPSLQITTAPPKDNVLTEADILEQIEQENSLRRDEEICQDEIQVDSNGVAFEAWYARMVGVENPPAELEVERVEEVAVGEIATEQVTDEEVAVEEVPQKLATQGDWSAYLDEEGTGDVYYFNCVTGESQWQVPSKTFPKVVLPKELESGVTEEKKKTSKVKEIEDDNDGDEQKPRALASEGPWTAYFDSGVTNMVYYFNLNTGSSQWEKPTETFPDVRVTVAMRRRILGDQKKKLRNTSSKKTVVVIEDFWTQALKKFQEIVDPIKFEIEDKLLHGTVTEVEPFNPFKFVQGFVGFFAKKDEREGESKSESENNQNFSFSDLWEMLTASHREDAKSNRKE